MKILAIENSSFVLSVAIKKDNLVIEENVFSKESCQFIISVLNSLLERVKVNIQDLDCFLVGLGPGSFTGLRIALSVVKGLSLVLRKPVVGVGSFLALAEEYSFLNKDVCIITDAKKNLIYGGVYRKERSGLVKEIVAPKLIKLEDFLKKYAKRNCLFLGESLRFKEEIKAIYPQALISSPLHYPKASFLISAGLDKFLKRKFLNIDSAEPLYLHPLTCQVRR
ncbi:MAG TPA: tRNA (adenosine(37)-N6)-threonylcarbamoyltransferase complex dimerization subunit type 1 TsaB [Candidatus Omnitrophica bacterium]|nr:MAG: tRNA (adenosine(37)-N6)-threonylcarbamoyltransferase complex dimerization subunit type 1 TsaB [Candidatus Omnitrophota bacterium]HEC69664.1 tRNA (adenosine(37)-N6)-threonylcarbamoyltransferase complex dimerization subunit type 1 TsaB [Candidatus Omnitrophota bacterium]